MKIDSNRRRATVSGRLTLVSVVADKFTRSYIGFSAFTNKVEEIDVTSWGIDAAYAVQLGKVAAGLLSAQYVAAPYSPEDFSKISQTNWRGAPDWSSIEAAVKTYCAANELDAMLVISKDRGTMPGTTIARAGREYALAVATYATDSARPERDTGASEVAAE